MGLDVGQQGRGGGEGRQRVQKKSLSIKQRSLWPGAELVLGSNHSNTSVFFYVYLDMASESHCFSFQLV